MNNQQKAQRAAIITLIVSVILLWFGARYGACCGDNWISNISAGNKVWHAISTSPVIFKWNNGSTVFAVAGFVIPWMIWVYMYGMAKPEKVGIEHGSSRWASTKEMLSFKNMVEPDLNLVFSQNSGLAVKQDKSVNVKERLDKQRNLNVAVIGGSGSGKTRFYVKPNLMQLHGNYFVTDPKGTVIDEVGHLMEDNGYEIKCFNVIPAEITKDNEGRDIPVSERKSEMDKSMCYNPLQYVKTKEQILAFVNCLIKNTNGKDNNKGDKFWEDSEKLLYVSVLSYMQDWLPPEDFTLPKLVEYINKAEAKEDDENFESELDRIFKEIETGYGYARPEHDSEAKEYLKITGQIDEEDQEENPLGAAIKFKNKKAYGCGVRDYREGLIDIPTPMRNYKDNYCAFDEFIENGDLPDREEWRYKYDFSVVNYNKFKKAAGETLKSIIISCNVRLNPITIPAVKRILQGKLDTNGKPTGKCEMELDKLGDKDKKRVIFAVMSDTNDTYFFLVAIMMYQVMDVLCNKALTDYGGSLPRFVHFILDEFANLGVLPDFQRTIAITRSRNIGVSMILQTPYQLESNYNEKEAKTIMDNCDTFVYLGGGSDGADKSTCKEISARLGKETIHTRTYNKTRSNQSSTSENNAIQGRDLMMSDEVARLPRAEELVIIKNTYPFRDKKFVLEKSLRYDLIDPESHIDGYQSKYDKNFNFEKYRDRIYEKQRVEELQKERRIRQEKEWQRCLDRMRWNIELRSKHPFRYKNLKPSLVRKDTSLVFEGDIDFRNDVVFVMIKNKNLCILSGDITNDNTIYKGDINNCNDNVKNILKDKIIACYNPDDILPKLIENHILIDNCITISIIETYRLYKNKWNEKHKRFEAGSFADFILNFEYEDLDDDIKSKTIALRRSFVDSVCDMYTKDIWIKEEEMELDEKENEENENKNFDEEVNKICSDDMKTKLEDMFGINIKMRKNINGDDDEVLDKLKLMSETLFNLDLMNQKIKRGNNDNNNLL